VVVLASWLAGTLTRTLFYHPALPFEAFFVVVAGYSLAMLFLALSASGRIGETEKSTFRTGTKILLCGPPALAATISLGMTIVSLKHRNFCAIIDCFSLNGFLRYHLPYFLSDFTVVSWQLYGLVFVTFLLIRLIRMLQKIL
jgi:hypothetical protein